MINKQRDWRRYIANKDVLCRLLYLLAKLDIDEYDSFTVHTSAAQTFLDRRW